MRHALIILVLVITWSSCTVSHEILINKDGSAEMLVDGGLDTSAYMIRIRNSEVISEIKDTLDYKVHFRINSIDSIGNYVPYLNKGYLSFKTYGDSILLSSGNTTPYNSSPGVCCHFVLVIRTEEPMDAYNTRGRIIRKKKGKTFNEFWLGQTIRQQVRGNKNIDVVFK